MAKDVGRVLGGPLGRNRSKSAGFSARIKSLKHSALDAVKNAETRSRLAEFVFWLCLLVSLTPLVFSFKGVFGSFAVWSLLAENSPIPVGWVADPKFGVFIVLTGLMAVCASIVRKPSYFVASATPAVAAFLGLTQPGEDIFVPLSLTYCAFAAISLGIFAIKGQFLSAPVAIFAVLTFFDSALIAFAGLIGWVFSNLFGEPAFASEPFGQLLSSLVLDDYGANIIDLLSFFVLLVTLRFSVHLIKDNKQIATELWKQKKHAKDAALRALRMWWLLPVVFAVLVFMVYPKVDAFIENRSMTWLQKMLLCEPANEVPDCVPFEQARTTPTEFEPMMRTMVDFSAQEMERSAREATQEIASQTLETADDLKNKIYPILAQKVLPPRMPGTNTRGCGKMNIPCHASNGVKSLANSGYRRLRDPPLRALEREIDNAYVAANGNVDMFRQESAKLIEQEIQNYRVRANIAIDKTVQGMKLIAIFSFVYSVMILIKTYGIAFARVIFDYKSEYNLLARLSDSALNPLTTRSAFGENAIQTHKLSPLTFKPADGLDYYIQSARQVSGGLGYPSIPSPFKAIRKRIFAGNYLMQFYDLTSGENRDGIGLQFEPHERMISVRVNRGDKFIFDFPEVVALSTSLKVRTFVTLSLHGLVFGKALYRIAEGEGAIILCLDGEPTVLYADHFDGPDERRDPKSFVAWRLDTPFKIQSKLSMAGLLASGYNIAKQKGGAAVLHNNEIRNGAARMGIARFVRTFLSPV